MDNFAYQIDLTLLIKTSITRKDLQATTLPPERQPEFNDSGTLDKTSDGYYGVLIVIVLIFGLIIGYIYKYKPTSARDRDSIAAVKSSIQNTPVEKELK